MRFGVCCGAGDFCAVRNAGYDYVEGNLTDVAGMDASSLAAYKAALAENGLAAECFNCFFPGDFRLVGEDVDFAAITAYVRAALERAAMLGGKIAVLGSGNARCIPDGFDRDRAQEQFLEVLQICGDAAAENGMQIAIEPLSAGETNFINTVAEGKALVTRCDHAAVGCLADFFHTFKSGESLDAVKDTAQSLLHVHLARANDDRRIPVVGEDDEAVRVWAAALKASGYDARISLEGVFYPDFETAINGVKPLLKLFN